MINFTCKCGKQIKVDGKYAGKKGKCPQCNNIVVIPVENKAIQKLDNPTSNLKAEICSKCYETISEGVPRKIIAGKIHCLECQELLAKKQPPKNNPQSSKPQTLPLKKETKACPYCGEEILEIAKKCKHCGEFFEKQVTTAPNTPLSPNQTEESDEEASLIKKPKKKRTSLKITIGVLLLLFFPWRLVFNPSSIVEILQSDTKTKTTSKSKSQIYSILEGSWEYSDGTGDISIWVKKNRIYVKMTGDGLSSDYPYDYRYDFDRIEGGTMWVRGGVEIGVGGGIDYGGFDDIESFDVKNNNEIYFSGASDTLKRKQ